MPEIRLTLTDDRGNQTERVFRLQGDLDTLDQIEEAVEGFKQQALPEVEKTLLAQAQERFATQEKKTRSGEQR
jgi:hypothetical protein